MLEVTTGLQGGPPRIVLYGDPGIGKSTFAASAPNAVFLPTEDGLRRIDCARLPMAKSYAEFVNSLGQVAAGEHGYDTLAVDSLGWLQRLIQAEVGHTQKTDYAEIGYGKGPQLAMRLWKEVVDGFTFLSDERGMGVVLIGHAVNEKYADPQTESYERITLALEKQASAYIREWADAVLYATQKKRVSVEDLGFKKTRATAKPIGEDGGTRVLQCSNSPACVAKNRYGITGEIPLSWDELAKYF